MSDMGEGEEDLSEMISDEDDLSEEMIIFEELIQKVGKVVFTPEELKERHETRQRMGDCCIKEIADLYHKLIDPVNAKKTLGCGGKRSESPDDEQQSPPSDEKMIPDNDDDEEDEGIVDDIAKTNARRRRKGLQRKYDRFRTALELLKKAPAPPFVRMSLPRTLNETGARKHLVQITRTQRPQIDIIDVHPKTVATTENHVYVFNANFLVPGELITENVETQTDQAIRIMRSHAQARVQQKGTVEISQEDLPVENFEYSDYPQDEKGNPIGKTTGICSYCARDILPLPTSTQLRSTLNHDQFYCCSKYKHMINVADTFERDMRAEYAGRQIEIVPKPKKAVDSSPAGDNNATAAVTDKGKTPDTAPTPHAKPEAIVDEDKKTSPGKDKEDKAKKGKDAVKFGAGVKGGKQKREKPLTKAERTERTEQMRAARKAHEAARASRLSKETLKEQPKTFVDSSLDTFDLPWDPYETVFGHERPFVHEPFDHPKKHFYDYADIVAMQSELFTKTSGPSGTRWSQTLWKRRTTQAFEEETSDDMASSSDF